MIDRKIVLLTFAPKAVTAYDTYTIDSEGIIRTNMNEVIDKAMCPVGFWLQPRDSVMNADFLTFVEDVEYSPADDNLRILTMNMQSAWTIRGIKQ